MKTCSIVETSNKIKNIITAQCKLQAFAIMTQYRIGIRAQASVAARRSATAVSGTSIPPVLALGPKESGNGGGSSGSGGDGTSSDPGTLHALFATTMFLGVSSLR